MSALADIKNAVDDIFREFGEDGSYIDEGGNGTPCRLIRFDPYSQVQVNAMGIENNAESVWVRMSEVTDPKRGNFVRVGDDSQEITAVQKLGLRGYAKLTLTEYQ